MKYVLGLLAYVLICLSFLGATGPQTLLDVSSVASEVKQLARPLKSSADIEERQKEAIRVRRHISNYVIRQLEAMPFISRRELETQLRTIIGAQPWDSCSACDDPPHVYAPDPGPNTTERPVVIAYSLS